MPQISRASAAEVDPGEAANTEISQEEISKGEDSKIVGEIPEKRTQFSKEFLLSDGLHLAVVYPEAVHYAVNGQWEEIDSTLKLQNDIYTNTAGTWRVSFPQTLTQNNTITIEKDEHTLRFSLVGMLKSNPEPGLDVMSAGGTAEMTAVESASASSGKVLEQEDSALQGSAKYPEAIPTKLSSKLEYARIFPDTDILYEISASQLKESIVLSAYQESLTGYQYILDTGELVPLLNDDGSILLKDSAENTIMEMPAPFLVDKAGVRCEDIRVTLEEKDGAYLLTYGLPADWLSEADRAWPVVLDPIVTVDTEVNNVRDATVTTGASMSYTEGILACGYSTDYGVCRTYLMYAALPTLAKGDVIISAEVLMQGAGGAGSNFPIEVHKVNGTWNSSSITWSNKPSYNALVTDYAVVGNSVADASNPDSVAYGWDVTDIVQNWYTGSNTGMMFKAADAEETSSKGNNYKMFFSSDYSIYMQTPILAIKLRNNNGLESYWDYLSVDMGCAGTGYVNKYTGNLVAVHNDIGFSGNRMPVSISHIYNSNDCRSNPFGMGYGWRTNFNQRVYQWASNSSYYVWEDGDGTAHYFRYASSGTYKDEDGLELVLKTTGSGTTKYSITDKRGNISYFDSLGRLTKQQNNQATKSSISVAYTTSSSNLISTITDGAGRKYVFSYSGGLLSKISFRGTGSTDISSVEFSYYSSEGNLASISDATGDYTAYGYLSNHMLSGSQFYHGGEVAFTYNSTATGKPNRITSITESDLDTSEAGGSISISYQKNQTTFTDHNGNKEVFQFNNWGNTVCVQDGEGRAQYAQYASDSSASAKGNQLTLSSKLQNTVGNVVKDTGFENGTAWTSLSSDITGAVTTSEHFLGAKAFCMTLSADRTSPSGTYGPSVTIGAGESYTFSAYVKTGAGEVYLAWSDGSDAATSEVLPPNSDWTRLQVTYKNNTSSSKSVSPRLLSLQAGTSYMDCVQVEKSPTASRYNLIENGDFRHSGSPAYGWTGSGLSSSDSRVSSTAPAPELDSTAFRITGAFNTAKSISQTVNVSGSASDCFVLAGWAKADSVPFQSELFNKKTSNPTFCLKAIFNNTDGTKTERIVPFNPYVGTAVNWQYAAAPVLPAKAYSSVTIQAVYGNNANTAYFDGIQLFKEQYGSSYVYDSKGNVTSVKDLQGQITKYEYDTSSNLTKEILPTGAKLTYTYDAYHNVKTATTETGLVYEFTYDTYGNNTSVSIVNGSTKISTSATYAGSGNRLATTTDAVGKVTTYNYNAETNVLEWVKYPNDTTSTRTNYTYDSAYRLARTYTNASSGSALTASYHYSDGKLQEISTASTDYKIYHGYFGVLSSVWAGNKKLAAYSYTSRNHYLSRLDFGNGDKVEYSYDSLGRVTKETYEDGDTVSYQYDNSGSLAVVTDSATGRKTTYYYDLTDRLVKYVETGENYNHSVAYSYDNINNLTSTVETINGKKHTTSFSYDDDNRVKTSAAGDSKRVYTYDSYGRFDRYITQHNGGDLLTTIFTYVNPSSTAASGQIAKMRTTTDHHSSTYVYTYDSNGNIASVKTASKTTTYVYDTANQLLRENNEAAGKTWTYSYDSAGNIETKKEYAYTTGTLGAVLDSISYVYSDGDWGDLLTSYDGHAITYDGVGNPLTDGTWTYTWEHGRQLASMSKAGTTWTYTYDADGMRTSRSNGSKTYRYVYNGGKLRQMTVGDDTLQFMYDANGVPMSMLHNGTLYYYVTNIQGDVVAILNTTGTAVVAYSYDAWGNATATTDSMAATLGVLNPLRYRGYVFDTETGLYYVASRYFNPKVARFINADGVIPEVCEALQGYNMFAYCFNNPVNMSDPSGNWPSWATIALGAVAAAAAVAVTVVTLGAAAPAAACALTSVGMSIGASYAVASTAATVAVAATTAAAAAYAGDIAYSAVTGDSLLLNTVFQGNADAYNTGLAITNIATAGVLEAAAQSPGVCFMAGTPILTASGSVPIEEIKAGDYVWAWDEETGEAALKEVVETYLNETDELVHIHVSGEEIICTPTHPFYSPVKGWTDAVHLRAGDILVLVNGEYVVVEKVQHEILESPVKVYNFQVADYHTYYVGKNSVLVHNTCQKFTKDQQAVIDLARENKKGVSRSEAETLVQWAKEYGIDAHGPEIHPNRTGIWSYTEHIKIFNMHIALK